MANAAKNRISVMGERVLVLRRRHGLTQDDLGEAIDIKGNTIARLERGRIQFLNSAVVIRLAKHFDITADYFMGLTNDERSLNGGDREMAGSAV